MSSLMIEEMSQFNASITVTELLMKTLENCAKELASRCIKEASLRHGFDASVEIRILGLDNLTLIRKQMAKKSQCESKKNRKVESAKKEKKSSFPMPFISELVNQSGCKGLAYNRGLFTQCSKNPMENGNFCKSCQAEADKNASGCPDFGTVTARMATGLYEFKDSKGRSPVSYVKVLDKLKLSQEAALEAAGKLNIEIPNEHFVVVEKPKKSKGRPKKTGTIQADNVSDMFAKLAAETELEVLDTNDSVEENPGKVSKKPKLSEEEKAAKKAALDEQRALKKAEREAKLAEQKAEREAERESKKAAEKAERESKKAAEKAERESKRAQEKAEREAKKAAEKAKKESAKGSKKSSENNVTKEETKDTAPTAAPATAEPAPAKVSVTRIQIGGKAYLKSSTNILYDPTTKEEIGLWDPETKTIKDLPEDEEDEEEYESD